MIKKIAGLLVVVAATLPASMVVTILIHPFWRWFEEATGIESFGHSGPAEWCYWLDYILMLGLFFLTRSLLKKKTKPLPE